MSLRDRFARRTSHDMLQQIKPSMVRPENTMEMYIGIQNQKLDSPRAQRLMDKALRVETRYEQRKRK